MTENEKLLVAALGMQSAALKHMVGVLEGSRALGVKQGADQAALDKADKLIGMLRVTIAAAEQTIKAMK